MARPISRDELKAKIDRGDDLVLVEALGPVYYEKEHLPGAINLPHDQVDELAPRLPPDLEAEVITYCASASCQNSAIAARRLEALGYRNVREYVEGKQDWIDAGLAVEAGAPSAVA